MVSGNRNRSQVSEAEIENVSPGNDRCPEPEDLASSFEPALACRPRLRDLRRGACVRPRATQPMAFRTPQFLRIESVPEFHDCEQKRRGSRFCRRVPLSWNEGGSIFRDSELAVAGCDRYNHAIMTANTVHANRFVIALLVRTPCSSPILQPRPKTRRFLVEQA